MSYCVKLFTDLEPRESFIIIVRVGVVGVETQFSHACKSIA